MKGLAASDAHFIRQAHDTLAQSVLCIIVPTRLLDQNYHRSGDARHGALAIKTLEGTAKTEIRYIPQSR